MLPPVATIPPRTLARADDANDTAVTAFASESSPHTGACAKPAADWCYLKTGEQHFLSTPQASHETLVALMWSLLCGLHKGVYFVTRNDWTQEGWKVPVHVVHKSPHVGKSFGPTQGHFCQLEDVLLHGTKRAV